MSKKDDRLYVGQMLDLTERVAEKAAGLLRQRYDDDENLRLALLHLVQTIGEAARRVSPAGQAA